MRNTSYKDVDAMSYITKLNLKLYYSQLFRDGFDDTLENRMFGYISALLLNGLMSINEFTKVNECMSNKVSTLTDDCLGNHSC